jgi:hypothetical protein
VVDETAPPSPVSLKLTKSDNGGLKITWQASADLESGLAGFEISKNGKVIATLPENPSAQFGRPLFQGMSYHDTPKEPLATMQFVDVNPSGGEYEIRSINTAGLKSEPAKIK